MISASYQGEYNVVILDFKGNVDGAQAKQVYSDLEKILPANGEEFSLLADLTSIDTMDPEVEGEVKKAMGLLKRHNVSKVLRVIDPDMEIGFNILSRHYYPSTVKVLNFRSREQAEAHLRDDGNSQSQGIDPGATKQLIVQRFSVTSSKPFQDVIERLEAAVGHPEMNLFHKEVSLARTDSEVENIVNTALGPSGFMEFMRFDHGMIVGKERGAGAPRMVRFVVGNPLIMKQMVERVPDAGSYAPVTILVDERPDGVHLSYDAMASYLTSYESPEAMSIAKDLDSKVRALLTAAA
jgi:uncharacterized protein (DUF302 family)/anti-anti-sigma regulatory factor